MVTKREREREREESGRKGESLSRIDLERKEGNANISLFRVLLHLIQRGSVRERERRVIERERFSEREREILREREREREILREREKTDIREGERVIERKERKERVTS